MEGGSTPYWATMAQVIPVFALAVVLEARAIAGKWGSATPTFVKVAQSVAWTLALATLAFGESVALRALRGEPPKSYWVDLCELAISWSVGMLILAPALQLMVKSFANPLARALTLSPLARIQHWLIQRKMRALNMSAEAEARELVELQERVEADLRDLLDIGEMAKQALDSTDDNQHLGDSGNERRAYLLQIDEAVSRAISECEDILARIDESREGLERSAEARAKLEKDIRSRREYDRTIHRQQRDALSKFLSEIE